MQSFHRSLAQIIRRCKRSKGVLLLFDFDGTLSAIVTHPSKASFLRGWKVRLSRLNRKPHIRVGIITGRALDDIRRRARVPGIIYAAAHGYDINRGSNKLLRRGVKYRRAFARLAEELTKELSSIPGAQVEYKGCAVAVHYRRVRASQRATVKRTARTIAMPYLDDHGWQLTGGKMVLEVRPASEWNKGHAARWIWKKVAPSFLPCYIGDDVTDEDAFRALGKKGITIRIGKKKRSHAQYYVRHVNDIIPWLERI